MAGRKKIKCTDEFMDEFCRLVATRPHSMVKICKDNPHLPSPETVYQMMLDYPEFRQKYTQAKEHQIESMLDDANNYVEEIEKYKYIDKQGNERIDWGAAAVARLKLDNTKWFAARLMPKKYAERRDDADNVTKQPINIYYDKKEKSND